MTENGQVVKVKDVSCTILIKGIFSIVPLFQVLANAQSSEPNQSLLQESCFNEVVMLYFLPAFYSFCVSFCLSMHTSVFCIFKQGEHKARDKDGAECKQDLPQAQRPHLGEEHVAGAGGKNPNIHPVFSPLSITCLFFKVVKMKTINEHLCSQVNIHEEKLCGITDELNNTW